MKLYCISLVLFGIVLAGCLIAQGSSTRGCPKDWFDIHLTIIVDELVPLEEAAIDDAELRHFRETLKLNDEEIEQVTKEAMDFYNTTYGLDFSKSEVNEAGERVFENAIMFPFRVRFDVPISHNRWQATGKRGSNLCAFMKEGGYHVRFTAPQRLFGTYGGPEGRLVPAERIVYVLFQAYFCDQQPTVITCRDTNPTFVDPDFYAARAAECTNRELGTGLLQGGRLIRPAEDPKFVRVVSRQVVTFPAHPAGLN